MDKYQDSRCLALEKALDDKTMDPIDLPFSFLKAITKGFSDTEEIGSGGFGAVYKGELPNGGMVAVKKLHSNIEVLEKNFQSEVDCLMALKHRNIVRFLGYCSEIQQALRPYEGRNVWADEYQRLFCFEYLSKGSLANYLTEASSGLPWRVRYQIIKGICQGVGYLHEQSIIHMDLKPENILVEDSMVPKIADFGISRRLSENQSKTITKNIVGSFGYLAPELITMGTITFKTDIFSLGVIIIELLMGCKGRPNIDKLLESWTDTFGTSETHPQLEQVKLCAEIGIKCMDDDPGNRPSMQDIIHQLDAVDHSSCSVVRSVTSISPVEQLHFQLADEVKSVAVSSALSLPEQPALDRFYQHYRLAKKACKPMLINTTSNAPKQTTTDGGSNYYNPFRKVLKKLVPESTGGGNELSESKLEVHPLVLCFPFEAKKRIECSLNIINRTDHHMFYWIMPQFPGMYTMESGFMLDPMCTGTVYVTMVEQEKPPLDAGMLEMLLIAMRSKTELKGLVSDIEKDPRICGDLVKLVDERGGKVLAAALASAVNMPT